MTLKHPYQTALILIGSLTVLHSDEFSGQFGKKAITLTEGTNIAATVSPDQKTIVMDLQGSLWSIPFEGGTAKQLTDPMMEPARPDYSPKGGLLRSKRTRAELFTSGRSTPMVRISASAPPDTETIGSLASRPMAARSRSVRTVRLKEAMTSGWSISRPES